MGLVVETGVAADCHDIAHQVTGAAFGQLCCSPSLQGLLSLNEGSYCHGRVSIRLLSDFLGQAPKPGTKHQHLS